MSHAAKGWKYAFNPQVLDVVTFEQLTSKQLYTIKLRNDKKIRVRVVANSPYLSKKGINFLHFSVRYRLPRIGKTKLTSIKKEIKGLQSNYRNMRLATDPNPSTVHIGYLNVTLKNIIESLEKIEDVLEKYLI